MHWESQQRFLPDTLRGRLAKEVLRLRIIPFHLRRGAALPLGLQTSLISPPSVGVFHQMPPQKQPHRRPRRLARVFSFEGR